MQPIWTVLIVLVAFFIVFHLRNRRRRGPEPQVYARRIDGSQIKAYLHPHIGDACLSDHGVQFGKGFRRKEGPQLPHEEGCHCRQVHFSFTSNEVFQGALRRPQPPEASIPGLSEADAVALLDVLRLWNGVLPAGGAEAALAGVDWSRFSPGYREALDTFLKERLAYLAARGAPQTQAPA